MKSKISVIFIVLLFILFILTINYKVNTKETSGFKDLPNLSDFQSLSESEKTIIIEKIDSISIDSAAKSFKRKIQDYINKEKLINLITLDIYEDNLLMYENQNKKQFNNLFIDVELSINNIKDMTIKDVENISYEMNKEIYSLFNENIYEHFKLNTVNVNFIDNNNKSNYEYVNSNTLVGDILNILNTSQSKEELETQNIVYSFIHDHKNFSLKKFGIVDNKNELYIEIPIYDIYDKENQATILQNLQSISDSLYNKIKSNTESKKYIENNSLSTITICFYTPWNKDKFITYNYDL